MNIIPFNSSSSLSSKVTNSAFWIFLFQAFDNLLGFIRLLILARLLTPNDFGLVGVAWLILQTINSFTQTGMHQTLIHKQNITNYLNTAWTYLLIRGLLLYSLVYLFAPLLGTFFNSPNSISIIRVIGLTLFFDGLVNIGVIYFQKELSFNKQFIYQLSGNIIDFIIAVALAFILKDVWAIVYGAIANSATRLLISYLLSSYRPRIEFNLILFKELNNYGKWIAGSNILQFIYSQGDDLLVGKILGTTSLGFYQLGYKISNLPATQITHLTSAVLFPAYSQIQDDKERISKIYIQVLQLISVLSFFIGTIIILFANDFTLLFLGEKWMPMVPAMQILTIWGIIRSIGATTGPVWQAVGTPKIVTKIQTLQVLILISIIYPFTMQWDIIGTSLAVVIAALIPNLIAVFYISKTVKIKVMTILKELVTPFIASVLVLFTYYIAQLYYREITLFSFLFLAIICFFSYFIIIFISVKLFNYSLYRNVYGLLKKYI